MKVEEWLEVYLETSLDPISVDDHITDDDFEEISRSFPFFVNCEDGTIYYDDGMYAYYHLNNEPENCYHYITIYDDEDDFDNDDIEEDFFEEA